MEAQTTHCFSGGESRLELLTEDFCSFFSSVTYSSRDGNYVDTEPTRDWETLVPRAVNVSLLYKNSSENRLVLLRKTPFTESEEFFARGTRAVRKFSIIDSLAKMAFLWPTFKLSRLAVA